MKAVEPLAKKVPTGDIGPTLLLGKSKGGNLEELGQIGQRILKEPPSSGNGRAVPAPDRPTAAAPSVHVGRASANPLYSGLVAMIFRIRRAFSRVRRIGCPTGS
jgi:hypothetical protein